MSALPLDVLPFILHCLAARDLQACSLVNRSFHQHAHPLLFTHLVLCAETWDRKCQFLLHDMNANRFTAINKLTIQLERLPVYESGHVPEELVALLMRISPQIDFLDVDGFKENELGGYNAGTPWAYISPIFRDLLCQHLMPSIQSLCMINVGGLPIFPVLFCCPRLRTFHFSSGYADPTADYAPINVTLPDITSLTLDPFNALDHRKATSLSHFIKCAGSKLSSFTVFHPFRGSYLSVNLHFLQQFAEIRSYLHHLSFGLPLYNFIVYGKKFSEQFNSTDLLPLASFSHLQTLSLRMSIPSTQEQWNYWFKWLTATFEASESPQIPRSFKALRLTIIPHLSPTVNFSTTPHPLDDLHDNFNFYLELPVPISLGNEMIGRVIALMRSTLPSWEADGRLKLWIDGSVSLKFIIMAMSPSSIKVASGMGVEDEQK